MANAKVEKTVTVTLEMSEAEARVLVTILRQVGGDPEEARGHVDSIKGALLRAKVHPIYDSTGYRTSGNFVDGCGTLVFADGVTVK